MIIAREDTTNKTINGIYVNDNMLVKSISIDGEVVSKFDYLPTNATFKNYFTRTGGLEYGLYGMNSVTGFPIIADNITAEGTGTLTSKYLCNFVQTRFAVNENDGGFGESAYVSLKEDVASNPWEIKVTFDRSIGISNIRIYNGNTLAHSYNTAFETSSMYIILVEMQIYRINNNGDYACKITVVNENNGSILGTNTINLPQGKKCGAVLYYQVDPMGSANPNVFYIYSRPKFNLDYLSSQVDNETATSGGTVGPGGSTSGGGIVLG